MNRLAILVLVLGSMLGAQEPRIVSLGLGRSRLEWVLEERLPLRPDDQARIGLGQLSFRERWLQRELPRLVDGIESIDMLERVLARSGASGLAATRDRILEVSGSDAAIAQTSRELQRLLERSDLSIRARAWVVLFRQPGRQPASPRLELLDEATLSRRMEELASSETTQIIETAEISFANGLGSSIEVGNRVEYVADHRLSSTAGNLVVEPLLASFKEGLDWQIGALQEPGSGRLHLESSFLLRRVQKPLTTLSGTIGPDGRRIEIARPVTAETRWATDRLVLGKGDRGFRVLGLQLVDPNLKRGQPAQQIEILCQLEVLAPKPKDLAGIVQGFDTEAQLAFVRLDENSRLAGDVVIFERDGKKIAEGRIEEILGSLATVRVTKGEPRMGDQLK